MSIQLSSEDFEQLLIEQDLTKKKAGFRTLFDQLSQGSETLGKPEMLHFF